MIYPRATPKITKTNFWEGNAGREAVVLHITQGGFASSIKYMADTGTSAHFITSKRGEIVQIVDTDDSAWCNGLTWVPANGAWLCPHKKFVTPTWSKITPPTNPNRQTISIEHEGFSGQALPSAQRQATLELLVWLGRQYPELTPYKVGSTLIGHYHLDPRDKAGCPGPGFDLAWFADTANRILGVTDEWRIAWSARGVPAPDGVAVDWAIPTFYREHLDTLGACVVPEHYPVEGVSLAIFEGGIVYYLSATGRAYLGGTFEQRL